MRQAARLAVAGLMIVVLSPLGGCAPGQCVGGRCYSAAELDALRHRTGDDYRKAAEKRAEQQRALQAEQQRALQAQREQEAPAQAQREQEAAAQEERTLKAAAAHVAADEARGYKHVSFEDFFLDYKTMPVGSKRAVKGYYRVFGSLETLAKVPYGDAWDNYPRVVLLTDSAPREVRAKLLDFKCRQVFCEVLLLGHTTLCTVTGIGRVRSDVCLAVDAMR